MPTPKTQKNDLGVKFGSLEMIYWRDIIEARKLDIKTSEDNLKYFRAILAMAEDKFKQAEAEFNKK